MSEPSLSNLAALAAWPIDASADAGQPPRIWPRGLWSQIEAREVCIVVGASGSGKSALSRYLAGAFAPAALRANAGTEMRTLAERLAAFGAGRGIDEAAARLRVRERLLLTAIALTGEEPDTPSAARREIRKFLRPDIGLLSGRGSDWIFGIEVGKFLARIPIELKLAWRPGSRREKPPLEDRVDALERLLGDWRRPSSPDSALRRPLWCVFDGLGQSSDRAEAATALTAALDAVHQFYVDFKDRGIAPVVFVEESEFARLSGTTRQRFQYATGYLRWTRSALREALAAAADARLSAHAIDGLRLGDRRVPVDCIVELGRRRPRDAVHLIKRIAGAMSEPLHEDEATRTRRVLREHAEFVVHDAEAKWPKTWPPLLDCCAAINPEVAADAAKRDLLSDLYATGLVTFVDRDGRDCHVSEYPEACPGHGTRFDLNPVVSIVLGRPTIPMTE
ncbi:MAG: hypothetical protein ACREC6_13875, partial [Hyphomicrobiaceae bacterium]